MRKYRATAASEVRVEYGIELVAGLKFFSETSSLAPSFASLNIDLDTAYTTRRAARKPLLEARAAFRFAHYDMDQVIRSFFRAVEIADGGRRGGPLAGAFFPDGLGPVVAPYGTRQIAPTQDLIGRLKLCKLPGAAELLAEWGPRLEASLAKLKSAADAQSAAREAYLDAFKKELALRNEHFYAIDKLMGLVRAAFPGDRVRQDLVFPAVDTSDDIDEAEGEPTPTQETPTPQ